MNNALRGNQKSIPKNNNNKNNQNNKNSQNHQNMNKQHTSKNFNHISNNQNLRDNPNMMKNQNIKNNLNDNNINQIPKYNKNYNTNYNNKNYKRKSLVYPSKDGNKRKRTFKGKYELTAHIPVKYKTVSYYMLVENVRINNDNALKSLKRGKASDVLNLVLDSLDFLSYIHK